MTTASEQNRQLQQVCGIFEIDYFQRLRTCEGFKGNLRRRRQNWVLKVFTLLLVVPLRDKTEKRRSEPHQSSKLPATKRQAPSQNDDDVKVSCFVLQTHCEQRKWKDAALFLHTVVERLEQAIRDLQNSNAFLRHWFKLDRNRQHTC